MTLEERIRFTETRVCKTVFPNNTNHHDTLFGGLALSMMDETAFIAATRFARQQFVTVSSDRIDFKQAIPAGSIIELVGSVVHVGRSSIKVRVDIYVEQMTSEGRSKAVTGTFTLVALDENRNPTPVNRFYEDNPSE